MCHMFFEVYDGCGHHYSRPEVVRCFNHYQAVRRRLTSSRHDEPCYAQRRDADEVYRIGHNLPDSRCPGCRREEAKRLRNRDRGHPYR